MEEEAEKLMIDAFSKNFIDYEEYPVSADIQNRCVSMIARLFNIPTHDENTNAMGTSTIGSSEAIMLATLAMKKRWQNKRKAEGKDYSRPNIIMNSAVQVCWEKAARYFDVEEKYVYCTEDRFVIDPEEAIKLIDENTIGICSILGTTYTGEYEDTKKINDILVERGIDCPIHVDAASGGFVAPFVNPDLVWDFRLEKVVSINVSGHKYGLVYPGVGWVVWRDPEFLPKGKCRRSCIAYIKSILTVRQSSSSTSTTSAPIKPPSHSTSPAALARSLDSTTSSFASARRATAPS